MLESEFNRIAPNGLQDLTDRVRVYLTRENRAVCESCGVENEWVLSDLKKTRLILKFREGALVLGPFVFACDNCHGQSRLIRPSAVGLREDIEVTGPKRPQKVQ